MEPREQTRGQEQRPRRESERSVNGVCDARAILQRGFELLWSRQHALLGLVREEHARSMRREAPFVGQHAVQCSP